MSKLLQEIARFVKKGAKRREDRTFIVEGPKMLSEVPAEDLLFVVASKSFLADHPGFREEIFARFQAAGRKAVFQETGDDEFRKISDTKTPQGVLAGVRLHFRTTDEVLSDPAGFYLILDNVQDPGNAGTILRAAEAANVSGVLFSEDSADPWSPKVVRATMGAVFRLPFAVVPSVQEAITEIRRRGGRVFATDLQGSVPHTEADFRGFTAVVFGNESKGLPRETVALADERIRIPMYGKTESLNVAMAATVVAYEALRQREHI